MHIPSIGLGTYRLEGQQAIDSVANGISLGYRHIDTAQIYGNEAEVGEAIADSGVGRDELFVTTKIWTANLERGKVGPSLKESLRKLRMEQVDLTLVHWPAPADGVPVAETLQALLEAREEGLTRQIGLSNFTIAQMKEAIAAVGQHHIATNQVEIHPFLQNRKVAEFARSQGLHLTAYMPLAYGRVMQNQAIVDIARSHQASPAQVTLAWLLQQGFAVIPSSTRRENLASNLRATDIHLTDEELRIFEQLDEHARIANPPFAPAWD